MRQPNQVQKNDPDSTLPACMGPETVESQIWMLKPVPGEPRNQRGSDGEFCRCIEEGVATRL